MQFSAPVDAEKEPAAQTEHDVAPMTGLYDPKPQSAQRTLPSLAVNLPFGHVWQVPYARRYPLLRQVRAHNFVCWRNVLLHTTMVESEHCDELAV